MNIPPRTLASLRPLVHIRPNRYQAFDRGLDPEELAEARAWHKTFDATRLPQGTTTFARSSGPGGQHVNKTESKALTSWPLKSLLAVLPRLLHGGMRASKHYTVRTDSLMFQAQDSRDRAANANANRAKLLDEVLRVYRRVVPGEARADTAKKYEAVTQNFHNRRLDAKKSHSAKKQSRRG